MALPWVIALRPDAVPAGTWLSSPSGVTVVFSLAVVGVLLTVPGTLASIASRSVDPDAIVIAEVFAKKTPQTPAAVVSSCRRRLKDYDDA